MGRSWNNSNQRGHGGRGSRKGSNTGDTTPSVPKAPELKFVPQTSGKNTGATYATIKEHICHRIQKTASEFPDGFDSAASTGVGDIDIWSFVTFDGNTWYGTGLKNFS